MATGIECGYPSFPMEVFWKSIIEPAFGFLQPRTIVEIGTADGLHTKKLLEYCTAHQAFLHTIDPSPVASVKEWEAANPAHLRVHADISLNVLGKLEQADVVLIDGDHNWYTVFHELKMLEGMAHRNGAFPVVFLHDIGWPYGRRDLYYSPDRIPAAFQKAFVQKGILPDHGLPVEEGGLNTDLCHAVEENNLKNGVRTAVEDFLKSTTIPLESQYISGLYGLCILAPTSLLNHNPSFQSFLHSLELSQTLAAHYETVERERVNLVIRCQNQNRNHTTRAEQTEEENSEIRRILEDRLKDERAQLIQQMEAEKKTILMEVEAEKIRMEQKFVTEKAQLQKENSEKVRQAESALRRFERTRSWRYTAWLRRSEAWLRSSSIRHLPYQIFGDIRTVWMAVGQPFPGLAHRVRYNILGPIWPVRPAPFPGFAGPTTIDSPSPARTPTPQVMPVTSRDKRPRVLLFVDQPQWAFSIIAQAIVEHLSDRFAFEILVLADSPFIDESKYDIVHVFFESEVYHKSFLHGKAKIVKGVYSHYWQLDGLTPESFYAQHLQEADAITVPSRKLLHLLSDLPVPVSLVPEGVDSDVFKILSPRTGPMTVGWAGDPTRPVKRVSWLKEACEGLCTLRLAEGKLTPEEMVHFYNSVDVIACSSIAEGCPRPLLEGMACGAFPVSFDVGVAQEMIDHERNGLIVKDESPEGLRTALEWCSDHLDIVRSSANMNAAHIRGSRNWASVLQPLAEVYSSIL